MAKIVSKILEEQVINCDSCPKREYEANRVEICKITKKKVYDNYQLYDGNFPESCPLKDHVTTACIGCRDLSIEGIGMYRCAETKEEIYYHKSEIPNWCPKRSV